jgi:predicted PurR-regulated permease PerM
MTWIVATIIILVILVVTYFIAGGGDLTPNLVLKDKTKDFVATKTINNFLENNFESLNNAILESDYNSLNNTLRSFLSSIIVSRGGGGWNFNSGDFYVITFSSPTSNVKDLYNLYNLDFPLGEERKMTFWENCVGVCQ